MEIFRGKFKAAVENAYEKDEVRLPEGKWPQHLTGMLNKVGRMRWKVWVRKIEGYSENVLVYIGRYMRGGPIKNGRLMSHENGKVKFWYEDKRDLDEHGIPKQKIIELATETFVPRYLLHVPEPGTQVVRSWGLYAAQCKNELERCREFLGQEPIQKEERK